jgi:hypothetical protein
MSGLVSSMPMLCYGLYVDYALQCFTIIVKSTIRNYCIAVKYIYSSVFCLYQEILP